MGARRAEPQRLQVKRGRLRPARCCPGLLRLAVWRWLSLDFGARVGADDPAEWQDRLSTLLPPSPAVAGARLRQRMLAGSIDADAVLNRELAVQNGFPAAGGRPCRWPPTAVPVLVRVHRGESDERTMDCECASTAPRPLVDGAARAPAPCDSGRSGRRSGGCGGFGFVGELCPAWLPAPRKRIRARIAALEQSANRRLARDSERMESYYGGLVAQIEKRAARHDAGKRSQPDRSDAPGPRGEDGRSRPQVFAAGPAHVDGRTGGFGCRCNDFRQARSQEEGAW